MVDNEGEVREEGDMVDHERGVRRRVTWWTMWEGKGGG